MIDEKEFENDVMSLMKELRRKYPDTFVTSDIAYTIADNKDFRTSCIMFDKYREKIHEEDNLEELTSDAIERLYRKRKLERIKLIGKGQTIIIFETAFGYRSKEVD